jgi:type I restriction enzyme S subunit
MKKDWTYKKLGEVGSVITGCTPSTKDKMNYSSQDVCFFKPSDLSSDSLVKLSKSEFYISKYAFEHSRRLPKGSVLTTCIGIIGKVGILTEEATCNQQINAIIPNPDIIISDFLGYSIMSKKHILQASANAPVVPLLNKTQFSDFSIPVPPLSIQRSIVAELDLLHSVISKKKEQLRELDNLAQSLFYQMFGDPITNPMGWEIKKLGEVAEAITGITYKPTDVAESGTIVLRSGNIQNGEIDLNDIVRVQRPISDKYFVQEGDILMCSRNGSFRLVGKAAKITAMSEKMTWGAFMTIIRSEINPYILAFLRTPAFRAQLTSAKTTTVNQITIGMLSKIPLPLPPLSLQQSFAAKVSAIEAQKQAVQQSIREVEALLAERMDNYFS